jgi:AcrR family transcriptional regulator
VSRKEAILQAAAGLFSERGFRDTSMSDIARVTGVADGTVFYHFKTKEELFLAVLENFRDRIIKEIERYLRESEFDSGLDMIEGLISFYVYLAGAKNEHLLLLHRPYPHKLAEVNPTCREDLEDIYNGIVDVFERAILLGQQDGSIGDVSARKTALIIFVMVDGLVRLNAYNLYQAGTLYSALIELCRRMLKKNTR